MIMDRSIGRSVAMAAVVAVAASVAAMPASADTHVGGSGPVGVHALVDSQEYPGVRCRYDGVQEFSGVRVRPPIMYARDRTSGRDRQPGAWRIVLQRQPNGGKGWEVAARSPRLKVTLRDDQPAAGLPVVLPHDGNPGNSYRVVVRMTWDAPGKPGTVQGTARHLVDWYRWPADPAHPGFCVGGIL